MTICSAPVANILTHDIIFSETKSSQYTVVVYKWKIVLKLLHHMHLLGRTHREMERDNKMSECQRTTEKDRMSAHACRYVYICIKSSNYKLKHHTFIHDKQYAYFLISLRRATSECHPHSIKWI